MNLYNHVGELIGKHLSHQAAKFSMNHSKFFLILWPLCQQTINGNFAHLICSKPDDQKEEGGYVDGEDTTYQRPAQGHLKHQLGPVFQGAEENFVNGILCQLVPVPFVLNLFRIESDKVLVTLWHAHPHVTGLTIKRIPLHVVDAPPGISVLLRSYNLVFRSLELI